MRMLHLQHVERYWLQSNEGYTINMDAVAQG